MKIKFRNTEVCFSLSGKGPVIVWLHGFLESKEIWKQQVSFFDNKFTNICIDLLGHGQTGCIDQVHTMELQAEVVKAVISHLAITNFSVVGHSMGGYVSLALIEKWGDRITHLVLLNSTSFPDTKEKRLNRERAIKIVSTQKESFVSMGIKNLFSETNRLRFSSEIDKLIKQAKLLHNQGITAALLGMKDRPARTTILKKFKGLKLIIGGEEDPVILKENTVEESKETNSTLVFLKGGHMSYLEVTLACNETLNNFFSR